MNWKLYYAITIPLWLLSLVVVTMVVAYGYFNEWPYFTAFGISTLLFGTVIVPPIMKITENY